MPTWLFQAIVIVGLVAIASELLAIHKRIKNIYRILTPAILEWYENHPGVRPEEPDYLDQ